MISRKLGSICGENVETCKCCLESGGRKPNFQGFSSTRFPKKIEIEPTLENTIRKPKCNLPYSNFIAEYSSANYTRVLFLLSKGMVRIITNALSLFVVFIM